MVHLTPKVKVPVSRAIEWFQGLRPLPGRGDEADEFFFSTQVEVGMLTEQQAAALLARHRRLTRQENREPEPLPAGLVRELLRRGWMPPVADSGTVDRERG